MDSVFLAVESVGDAWSWLLMREALIDDVRRFDEFRSRLGIARSTLAARLAQLVANGLLRRSASSEYLPTQQGEEFFACLMVAMRWGDHWYPGRPDRRTATHHLCGGQVRATLQCSQCHQVVVATDVDVHGYVGNATAPFARNRSPAFDLLERNRSCGIAATTAVIGERWSSLVIRESFFRTRRFDEFERRLGIAPNILSQRLTRLVDHGILTRAPYQERPVRHEYRLTDKGLDIYPIPLALLNWGDRWLAHGRSPIALTHRPCGQHFTGQLSCGSCDQPINRADVQFSPETHRGSMTAPASAQDGARGTSQEAHANSS